MAIFSDTEAPLYTAGRVGLYTEDADVRFADITAPNVTGFGPPVPNLSGDNKPFGDWFLAYKGIGTAAVLAHSGGYGVHAVMAGSGSCSLHWPRGHLAPAAATNFSTRLHRSTHDEAFANTFSTWGRPDLQ